VERKEPDSLITKLLAKRDNIAAHVYDKRAPHGHAV